MKKNTLYVNASMDGREFDHFARSQTHKMKKKINKQHTYLSFCLFLLLLQFARHLYRLHDRHGTHFHLYISFNLGDNVFRIIFGHEQESANKSSVCAWYVMRVCVSLQCSVCGEMANNGKIKRIICVLPSTNISVSISCHKTALSDHDT